MCLTRNEKWSGWARANRFFISARLFWFPRLFRWQWFSSCSYISLVNTSLVDRHRSKVHRAQNLSLFPLAPCFTRPLAGAPLCNSLIIQLIRNYASSTLKNNQSCNLNAIFIVSLCFGFFSPSRGGVCYRCFFRDDLRFAVGCGIVGLAGIVPSETHQRGWNALLI